MRILFFGPGSSWHVTRWADAMRRLGHEVTLASMHPIDPAFADGAVALAPALAEGATSPSTLLRSARRARQLVRSLRPDVGLAYYMSSYGLLAALSGQRPYVGAAAGGDVLVDPFDRPPRRAVNRALLTVALGRAAGMLCWAPHVADRLAALGVPRERILVQPRGVDLREFAYRPPTVDPHRPLRVFSSRLFKPLYRIDTLVEALVLLEQRGCPVEARLAGWGPEKERLAAIARDGGAAGRVHFLGKVPPARMPEEMRWADVYVSTSSTDGASATLFEALAIGLFPVVSDIPANRAFLEEDATGLFFPVGDAAALADRLELLARERGRVREGVEASRGLVREQLDYGRNIERITRHLEGVVAGTR
jgi:glycosyltransferase involved in cell wall biosynthesis